jgi:hypothetical protein
MWEIAWRPILLGVVFSIDLVVLARLARAELSELSVDRLTADQRTGTGVPIASVPIDLPGNA